MRGVYESVGAEYPSTTGNWETPTGHAVDRVAAVLAALPPEPASDKYVLLITDGDADTCQIRNPQCGQDRAVRAVQDARAAGIVTVPIGIDGTPCNSNAGRCGADYIQDLANAGAGLVVEPPPPNYEFQQCVVATGGLTASYGNPAGSAPARIAGTVESLREVISDALQSIIDGTAP